MWGSQPCKPCSAGVRCPQAATGEAALGGAPVWHPQALAGFVGVSGAYDLEGLAQHLHRRGLYKNLLDTIMSIDGQVRSAVCEPRCAAARRPSTHCVTTVITSQPTPCLSSCLMPHADHNPGSGSALVTCGSALGSCSSVPLMQMHAKTNACCCHCCCSLPLSRSPMTCCHHCMRLAAHQPTWLT